MAVGTSCWCLFVCVLECIVGGLCCGCPGSNLGYCCGHAYGSVGGPTLQNDKFVELNSPQQCQDF